MANGKGTHEGLAPGDRRVDAMTRRDFLRLGIGAAAGAALVARMPSSLAAEPAPDVVVAHGGSIPARLRAALKPLGGISRFVHPGAKVVLKPNAAFLEPPQTGGNTRPEVVAAVVAACQAAGASSITIVEHGLSNAGSFGTDHDLSGMTGVAHAAKIALLDPGDDAAHYSPVKLDVPGLPEHPIARAFLDADVVINLPRLKTHPYCGYTMCIKNLMGVMHDPSVLHNAGWAPLVEGLACLGHALQPHIALNIVDGTDLVRDWAAGRPGSLTPLGVLVAGVSMASVDAVSVTFLGEEPLGRWKCDTGDSYLRVIQERGWGQADPTRLRIARINL